MHFSDDFMAPCAKRSQPAMALEADAGQKSFYAGCVWDMCVSSARAAIL